MRAWHILLRMFDRSPRYLLLGPAGAGKTALVNAAVASASPTWGRRQDADRGRVGWNKVARGVIVDVPGSLAFPPGDRDLRSWERLLRQLRRLRPRRPLDGIILAIPASLLLDPTLEEDRVHLAAAIRERFAVTQGLLGFTVPVYVVITKVDEIRGFDAFTRTLSDDQLRNMLGWSNPHGTEPEFVGDWVAEGLDTLHDAIVSAQVERFASSTRLENSADIFVFSGLVRQLGPNLRALLEEVFRPSLYHGAFYCRGFYLCGRPAQAPSSIAFLDDLLVNKVFAERGLATPLADVTALRRRSRTIAQVVGALLILGLAAGMYWGETRLRRAKAEFGDLLTTSSEILSERADARARGGLLPVKRRLEQSRGLLNDQLRKINDDRFSPMVYALNPQLRTTLTRIFQDIVLDDFRAGLEDKARDWLRVAEARVDDPAPSGPDFQKRPRYQRLARFAQGYSSFVENYLRYDQFVPRDGEMTRRRADGRDDFRSLVELNEYLDGAPLKMQALGRPFARSLRNANATAMNCGIFEDSTTHESLVSRHASALLEEFRSWSFGDQNPLQQAALNFTETWTQVSTGDARLEDLDLLIEDTAMLADTVKAWTAIGPRPADERIALFETQPFTPHALRAESCPSLAWPDLPDEIQQTLQLKDALRERLLEMEAVPFGAIFNDDPPGLTLSDAVIALEQELDALKRQSFWAPANPPYTPPPSLRPYATWRSDDVDDVVKTADAFTTYKAHRTTALDDSSRDALFGIVEPEVSELLARRLLQTANEGPKFPADLAAMSQQVQVLGTVITRIRRIEPLLGRSESGRSFLVSLDQQATEALNQVDRDARRSFPWVFVWPRQPNHFDGLFNKWLQLRDSAPAAEPTRPADDAANLAEPRKRWEAGADNQRDAVLWFASLARPLADYLSGRRIMSDRVLLWQRIERDAAAFEQKRPDTALSAFDAMMRTIPTIVPANNCGESGAPTPLASGDFFGPLRVELALAAKRQCHQRVQDDYQSIARVFTDNLRDRFPFVDASGQTFAERIRAAEGRPEATLDSVKALLSAYTKANGPSLKKFLEDRRTCSTDPALGFLQRIDSASKLLASAADPQLKTPAIVLNLRPEFRLLDAPRTGGDQIAEWRMMVGSKTAREPVTATSEPLPWTTGDKVSVVVRFARDSPNVPSPGSSMPPRAGEPDERTVHFDFSGDWALFRLLLARTITRPADVLRLRQGDVPQTVLAFQIPVQQASNKPPLMAAGQGSPFEVHMRLGMFAVGKTEALTVGPLPSQAPTRVMCIF